MHATPRILCIALALTGWAVADLPKKAPLTKYAQLWTHSPFTSKPPPPKTGDIVNTFEDYTLLGVAPVTDGYRVTLLNKKKPEEARIVVESHKPAAGFEIRAVSITPGKPLETVVSLASGANVGTVSFEDKFITLAAPAAPKPAANPQTAAAAPVPGQAPPPNPVNPQLPRPRTVPTPNNTGMPQQVPGQTVQPKSRPNHRITR